MRRELWREIMRVRKIARIAKLIGTDYFIGIYFSTQLTDSSHKIGTSTPCKIPSLTRTKVALLHISQIKPQCLHLFNFTSGLLPIKTADKPSYGPCHIEKQGFFLFEKR